MTETDVVGGDRLRSFVERIEHVEAEIASLTEGKKEIYAEAKGEGYDVKVLREVVRIRKQDRDEREEHETLLEVYLRAVETGAPLAMAAE
jgi:uncharacterized protein (UPF0335 family)